MKVQIVQYDPAWPDKFNELRSHIADSCGELAGRIEHIGSTSVPGLGAKPIIDILLGVRKEEDLDHLIPPMLDQGYVYRNDFEHIMPYRRYFSVTDEVHVHSVVIGSEFWNRHLAFRDYLRVYDDERDMYLNVKSELAQKDWNDRNDYAYAKTDYVRGVEKKAFTLLTDKCELAEANSLYDSYQAVPADTAKDCGMYSASFGSARAVRTDAAPMVLTNRVIGMGIDEDVNETTLQKVFEFYGPDCKTFGIQIAPSRLSDNVRELLLSQNLIEASHWIRYYKPAQQVNLPVTSLSAMEAGKDDAETFGKLICEVYSMPPSFIGYFASVCGRENWHCFMAYDKQTPISAGVLFKDGDTAWIGMAGTLAEHRGKGAQKLVIAQRMKTAYELGCKWITVETGPDSEEKPNPSARNIMKMGFNPLYKRPNFVYKRS